MMAAFTMLGCSLSWNTTPCTSYPPVPSRTTASASWKTSKRPWSLLRSATTPSLSRVRTRASLTSRSCRSTQEQSICRTTRYYNLKSFSVLIIIHLFIGVSVTRWLVNFLNNWPLKTIKVAKFCQIWSHGLACTSNISKPSRYRGKGNWLPK